MTKPIKILLDLDGVLITNLAWKADEMANDGYSKFNDKCVRCFNSLIERIDSFELWLSSSRRKVMSLEEFNVIFENRGIATFLTGFVPVPKDDISRRAEVEAFARARKETELLIIDDDSSLQGLSPGLKSRWIATNPFQGFTEENMRSALKLIGKGG